MMNNIELKDGYLLIEAIGSIPSYDYQGRPLPPNHYGNIIKGDIPDIIKEGLNKVKDSFVIYQPFNGLSVGKLDLIHHQYIEGILSYNELKGYKNK